MTTIKFVTAKGSSTLSSTPFYVGFPQHERTLTRREAYEYLAEKTGYKATAIRAVFMGLGEFIRENAAKGNSTLIDEVASIRNFVRGAFATSTGPWVKGKNYLLVQAVEMDPFKSILADVVPTNKTDGAKPTINTVFDETTKTYDVVTGTDPFSIAGADLAPDTSKADEYVAFIAADGTETKAEITYSDLQNVKAKFETPPAAGSYTLKVYTRSGLGSEYGVAVASRKITVE